MSFFSEAGQLSSFCVRLDFDIVDHKLLFIFSDLFACI